MAAPLTQQSATDTQEREIWRGGPSLVLMAGTVGRSLILFIIGVLLTSNCASIALFFSDSKASSAVSGWVQFLGISAILISIGSSIWRWIWLKSLKYSLTTQRVKIEKGIISRSVQDLDLRLVDDTSFTQGVLDRLLGIGHVKAESHDEDVPVLHMRGIREPRKVRELIRSEAYARSQKSLFTRRAWVG